MKFAPKLPIFLMVLSIVSFYAIISPQPTNHCSQRLEDPSSLVTTIEPKQEKSPAFYKKYVTNSGKAKTWLLTLILLLSINFILKRKK